MRLEERLKRGGGGKTVGGGVIGIRYEVLRLKFKGLKGLKGLQLSRSVVSVLTYS